MLLFVTTMKHPSKPLNADKLLLFMTYPSVPFLFSLTDRQ